MYDREYDKVRNPQSWNKWKRWIKKEERLRRVGGQEDPSVEGRRRAEPEQPVEVMPCLSQAHAPGAELPWPVMSFSVWAPLLEPEGTVLSKTVTVSLFSWNIGFREQRDTEIGIQKGNPWKYQIHCKQSIPDEGIEGAVAEC